MAYRVRASFLPGPGKPVAERIEQLKLHEFSIAEGAVLETGCVYIIPLVENLALPRDVAASTNPKSSTGRLDIFTRVISDQMNSFDSIEAGYRGPLYVEVSPRTFPILVREGSRLSQIRFHRGRAGLSADELEQAISSHRVEGDSVGRLALSVDLLGFGSSGVVGYRAKRHAGLVDVDWRAAYLASDFWEPIPYRDDASLILDPNEFYILASKEAVQVPPDFAAEMQPFDPMVGEFRVHYAGFFDPGFGYSETASEGARAVLEVRSREVPFILEHGQTIGKLSFERVIERPTQLYGQGIGSNYQAQLLKLSKQFRPFT